MIAVAGNFRILSAKQFLAKQLAIFSKKNNVIIPVLRQLAVFLAKIAIFWLKYLISLHWSLATAPSLQMCTYVCM
jgi:hypothetical protein